MSKTDQQLSPAEVSRLLGISPKALRLYEARGMVKPARGLSGWRVFGRDQISRLHQIKALKALRLPLARIAELLAGRSVTLDGVLAIHERALAAEAANAGRALGLIRAARSRLAAGMTLSIGDLATLATETTMTTKLSHKDVGALLEPHVVNHFSKAEIEDTARLPFDQEKIGANWDSLIAEATALAATGDPASPAAMDLARRWKAQVEQFTRGDPGVAARVQAVWTDALADPRAADKLPLNRDIFVFMGIAQARLAAAGG